MTMPVFLGREYDKEFVFTDKFDASITAELSDADKTAVSACVEALTRLKAREMVTLKAISTGVVMVRLVKS